MKTDPNEELKKLVDKEEVLDKKRLGQLSANKKNKEIALAKIAAGTFVSNNLKYDEQCIFKELCNILEYVIKNEGVTHFMQYYLDPLTEKKIPYGSLKATYGRHPICDGVRSEIKAILEFRLEILALNNKTNANFTRFVLQNNYGWKERTEQDITVSTKEIKFNFGNPELNDTINIDKEQDE